MSIELLLQLKFETETNRKEKKLIFSIALLEMLAHLKSEMNIFLCISMTLISHPHPHYSIFGVTFLNVNKETTFLHLVKRIFDLKGLNDYIHHFPHHIFHVWMIIIKRRHRHM